MTLVNKLKLITQTASIDAIGQLIYSESEKELICEVKSVSRSEFIEGRQAGLDPAFVFLVSVFGYNGERIVEYKGERLVVERTYQADENFIELHVGREVGIIKPDPTPTPTNGGST